MFTKIILDYKTMAEVAKTDITIELERKYDRNWGLGNFPLL